jgi:hypothetical protein
MEAKGHHLNGRIGVRSNRSIDPELVAALHEYFEDIKKMGAPRATRIVCDELGGFGVRDDDVEVIELSSMFLTEACTSASVCQGGGHQ